MIPLEDPTTLSLLFHLNSEPWLNDDAYRSAAANQETKRPATILAEIPLPSPPRSALARLIARRQSVRSFAPSTLAASSVAALLQAAYGILDGKPSSPESPILRRSVPSAGGLYPLEVYALCRAIEGLPDGIYHYDVIAHGLQHMMPGDPFPRLESMLYTYSFIEHANVVIALAAQFKRTQKKYGPRGYRYILLEAGHVGQNVCLMAAELGLASLCMGGYIDSSLNTLLGLDSMQEGVVYTLAVGVGASPSGEPASNPDAR
jgi:SagB-type dehydrogenase family enzyme